MSSVLPCPVLTCPAVRCSLSSVPTWGCAVGAAHGKQSNNSLLCRRQAVKQKVCCAQNTPTWPNQPIPRKGDEVPTRGSWLACGGQRRFAVRSNNSLPHRSNNVCPAVKQQFAAVVKQRLPCGQTTVCRSGQTQWRAFALRSNKGLPQWSDAVDKDKDKHAAPHHQKVARLDSQPLRSPDHQ